MNQIDYTFKDKDQNNIFTQNFYGPHTTFILLYHALGL